MFSTFLNYPLCDLAWGGTFCAWVFVLSHAPSNGAADSETQESTAYIRRRAHAIAWSLTGCVAFSSLISIGGPAWPQWDEPGRRRHVEPVLSGEDDDKYAA